MSRYNHGKISWFDSGLLDDFGRTFLRAIGYPDTFALRYEIKSTGKNVVVEALRKDPRGFVEKLKACNPLGDGMDQVSRLVVLCQMVLYDFEGGPEGDWTEKSLRRHWYAYFKQFSQMFGKALGKTKLNAQGVEQIDDVQWAARLSNTYSGFVNSRFVTYRDLWVKDASRMFMAMPYNRLFPGFTFVVAVEKDSQYDDFVGAAKAAGASGIVSGKGKMSMAASELFITQMGWSEEENPFKVFSVLSLSDHDFDGEAVIGPTFAQQIRRYLDRVYEERIGVMPYQVEAASDNPWDSSYKVKTNNNGYIKWSFENALFWAVCDNCGHEQFTVGLSNVEYGAVPGKRQEVAISGVGRDECSRCAGELIVDRQSLEEPHGYEVEALRSSEYYRSIARALLRQLDFDFVVEEIRKSVVPESYVVSQQVREQVLDQNNRYQKILEAIDVLEQARAALEDQMQNHIQPVAEETIDATREEWQRLGEDPQPEDYEDHIVQQAPSGEYARAWQPFSLTERNRWVAGRLTENDDLLEALEEMDIEDFQDVVDEVNRILQD